ncbi:class I SAM-dependent methyltransferase [Burkholderia contaminans]|uniref:class I SAM-dependent methyltransferase n=1 Tax=Burkholderia contaminans TaxID=488447 RepID=UPI000F56D847|nr:class I SAM-dependent methyltransferase [Burkholderia contaminans]RQT39543.1 class I SAM-dependent methyltransferase [Burkholderia contaminans]
MRTLQQLRLEFLQYRIEPVGWLGDSPSRFDFYTETAIGCDTILELGVFTGLTTTAFMLAQPKRLVSVDISDEHFRIRHELEQAAKDLSVDFEFRIADDLAMEPLASDLLFIDTTHTYEQTLAELNRFGPLARKKIVLHDMTTAGVYQAVFQWLWDNKQFHITYHDSRGCGAVVCERHVGY